MASPTHGTLLRSSARHVTGYLFHELYFWHDQGHLGSLSRYVQPTQHWEHPDTKRRIHGLLHVSGMLDHLKVLQPRPASYEELTRVHSKRYVDTVMNLSQDETRTLHRVGDEAMVAAGGAHIAALSAGGALVALEEVMGGNCQNAYALVRPPGHHAERDEGMGFCLFNNIAIAARHAQKQFGVQRVAIVDYDVHHGNGTQHVFEEESDVLFISIHQDSCYPVQSGAMSENGKGAGEGFTINIPLPPGSGSGAYRSAFQRVILPALEAYRPEVLLVSAGFDACYLDPLGSMMLSSEDYRWIMTQLRALAESYCEGRLVALHEGGYSDLYVPFCGLATIEALSGVKTDVSDPFLDEVHGWGYQELQAHQEAVIQKVEPLVGKVKERLRGRGS